MGKKKSKIIRVHPAFADALDRHRTRIYDKSGIKLDNSEMTKIIRPVFPLIIDIKKKGRRKLILDV